MTRDAGPRVDAALAALAEAQHGVVGRSQLRDLGIEKSGIDSRVRRRALLPIHRGVYAVGHRRLTMEERWMAAVLAAAGAVLSHRSAGQLWGVLPRTAARPEVTRPGHFRRRSEILAHRSLLPVDEVDETNGIPVTAVSRTLLDLGAVLPAQRLEQALNQAEVLRLTSRLSLPELLDRYPCRRGTAALRRLLDEGRAASGVTRRELEARFAAFVEAHDLPRPRRNAALAVSGRIFEVDCLWRAQRLIAELDGRAVHGTRLAFEADRERDRLLLVEGWRVMRITWAQLRDDQASIASDLRRLLAA
jgi:Protein of unknown function (DUF559)